MPAGSGVVRYRAVHGGKGAIDITCLFREKDGPALLLIYDLPPGASEGMHTHEVGDPEEGSYDEFYYILSGSGEMQISDETIPMHAGDHILVPNGVAHGIENTSSREHLRVHLVALVRD